MPAFPSLFPFNILISILCPYWFHLVGVHEREGIPSVLASADRWYLNTTDEALRLSKNGIWASGKAKVLLIHNVCFALYNLQSAQIVSFH